MFSSNFSRMKDLEVLPEELLEKTIRNILHNSLPALGRCSRKFHRLIVPQLYRCVYFDGSDYAHRNSSSLGSLNLFCKWKGTLPIFKPADEELPPYEPSQIFKLGTFLRTIQSSKYLRSQVVIAALGWFDTYGMAVPEGRDLQRVSTILSYLLPSLQAIHLSAVVPPASIIPFELNLTSLALVYDNFNGQLFTIEDLYRLFCIKALRHLTLDSIIHWDRWTMPGWNFRAQGSVSNLISLSLPRLLAPVDIILRDITTWPKALEKVNISIIPDPQQEFSTAHSIIPLLCHRESLTELHISTIFDPPSAVRGNDGYYDPAKSHNLNALKRLYIPLEHFMVTRLGMVLALGTDSLDFSAQTLLDTIPPGLEQLTIECPQGALDDRSQFNHQLSLWQKAIRKHQARHPNLKNVIVVLRDPEGA